MGWYFEEGILMLVIEWDGDGDLKWNEECNEVVDEEFRPQEEWGIGLWLVSSWQTNLVISIFN